MPRDFSVFIEQWRPVRNYAEYEVSNFGRIRSLWRLTKYRTTVRSVPARLLHQFVGPHGYLQLVLCSDKVRETFTVHSLVAEAFIGPRSFGFVVHHIDSDKLNNYAINLTYITFHENLEQRVLSSGENHYSAKLRDEDIPRIRFLAIGGRSYSQIADFFRVNPATIYDVVKRRTWKHII